jgi:hypothetical protein
MGIREGFEHLVQRATFVQLRAYEQPSQGARQGDQRRDRLDSLISAAQKAGVGSREIYQHP